MLVGSHSYFSKLCLADLHEECHLDFFKCLFINRLSGNYNLSLIDLNTPILDP
jgi:hypothetical protein